MNIHARALKYFDTIRRCGSIREAARRLHVASSAVNRQLLQLEEEIGAPLFERMPGGLKLTAAGEAFSRHVISVLQDEQRLLAELDALKGIRRGEIKVISVEGLNANLLPAVLERMLTRYPTIKITVRSAGSAQTAQAVIDGDADVAIGFSLERSEALRQCAVGRFALGAIVPPAHPLAQSPQVSFAECARYPLILAGPELSIHHAMRPLIRNHKRPITVLLESASIELAKTLAIRGVGVAFQTRIGIEREVADGLLVHLPLKAPGRLLTELGVYVRAGRTLPPALDAFIRFVEDELEQRAAQEAAA
ncbi:LysR family transcriptional regulator [Caldimonas thermodepolymerans]|uniref:DNA-binding transcriptional LysR family regulator n=1 Tax=Caldimonas thermodepolymerans TaxID=215580 RepID=A0AA46DC07_9BURK|nr:LysR family transcriptional regulator [Caldimonas thermodepolymerans]TCP04965.1 DNA-binding transcriptional LysR family regulator [Caldimonas thermodepolymerans]UZG48338.1 LysR family transcriptional regulator [Caldimonas thermodepolymerans]